ncbi:DUF3499 domain-containing protein [Corynebacterium sp. zg-331]|uniref:DUF3499 domain-containing protein n=1 Tax=unclassified Corynebacterium TaxID=2624378 RepID=UPI001642D890|nr:DUF3499 domain-containing protein [Corynebacterium sp. zg-331]
MQQFRRCSRPGCGKPAVATLTYAYAESTAVVGPLAPSSEPHSWDLCAHHAERITAPLGWEMLRVEGIEMDEDEDLTALAEAVREAGRFSTGLVAGHDPRAEEAADHALRADTSVHPVHRSKRLTGEKQRRRAHLRVVRDDEGAS